MAEQKEPSIIGVDWISVFRAIKQRRQLYYKTLPIAFVLACAYILCFPRYYTTDVSLAPELDNSGTGGALSSIASSFGFDLGDMQTSDAITPLLYPDLLEDNGFVANLFGIKVDSKDGQISTSYHDYLKFHQKIVIWRYPFVWLKNKLSKPDEGSGSQAFDPYRLSKKEDNIMKLIRSNIKINVDKKTAVISINVTDQDPLICKTVADSLKNYLQNFITDYRTSKARTDMEYYKKLTAEAKQTYEQARQRYGSFADANTDVVLQSFQAKQNDLENDMQLKYNNYTTLSTQLQAAIAKVQERTPVFTVIKGAAVPVKPAGPKRMIFVGIMLVLTFLGTSLYILKDIVKN